MKLTVILSVATALVAVGVAVLILRPGEDAATASFNPELLASASPEKASALIKGWMVNEEATPEQKIDFIKWVFVNQTAMAEAALGEGKSLPGSLPEQLAAAGFDLLQERQNVAAVRLIASSRLAFPNDPNILGLTGVAAILANRKDDALQFLAQAESWRRDIPMVDFYLGGLLVESDLAADRARGKALLERVAESRSKRFSEPAALTLLADRRMPVQPAEYRKLFEQLKAAKTFQVYNNNLNIDILRILMNRTLAFYPEEVLSLTDVMAKFPGATRADIIGLARLAQNRQSLQRAQQLLDQIGDAEDLPEGSEDARNFAIAQSTQMLMTNQPEKGLALLDSLVTEKPDDPTMAETLSVILETELPLQVKRDLLQLVLRLEQVPVQSILWALEQLIEIDPIRADNWRRFAVDRLLEAFPSLTGSWLIGHEGAPLLTEVLMAKKETSEAETNVLIEALLFNQQAEAALAQLEARSGSLQPVLRSYLKARALALLNRPEEALELWREAHNIALSSDAFPMIKNLGMLALQLNQQLTALQTLYSAFSAGIPFSEEQAGLLLGLTLSHGNLVQSIRVAGYLESRYPDNPQHKNNLAYFKFLADEDLDHQVDVMRAVCDEFPEITPYRLTLALGLLKIGRKNEAARLIQNTQVNWTEADNRAQFIYAIILAANNQRVVAQGLLQNIDQEALIPEERALLETL